MEVASPNRRRRRKGAGPALGTDGGETTGSAPLTEELPTFRPFPIPGLLLCCTLGAGAYVLAWMYENWVLYRRAYGYSRERHFRSLEHATGFRHRPGWRALLGSYFVFSLFEAIARESRLRRLPAFPTSALGILLAVAAGVGTMSGPLPTGLVLGVVLFPAQATINRMNRGQSRLRISAVEALALVVGFVWQAFAWGMS